MNRLPSDKTFFTSTLGFDRRPSTMARHGLRTRPHGGDPRAADGDHEEDADGDGRRIT